MQRSRESVESRGKGIVHIRKGGTDQMRGMSGCVPRLMVTMNNEIEAHQISVAFLISNFHQTCKVRTIIMFGIVFWFLGFSKVFHAIDISRDQRQFCGQVEAVFKSCLPVSILFYTVIFACKDRSVL